MIPGLRRLASLSIALSLVTCTRGPDAIVDPLGPPKPAFNLQPIASDDCESDSSCHPIEISYSDSYWECPRGCYTYPLSSLMRSRINTAMGRIDRTLCPWAYNFVQQLLIRYQVRTYGAWDGRYGDFHMSSARTLNDGQGPDYGGALHIWDYQTTNSLETARTLVHEAWHGYFNSGDETAAEGNAIGCTK